MKYFQFQIFQYIGNLYTGNLFNYFIEFKLNSPNLFNYFTKAR